MQLMRKLKKIKKNNKKTLINKRKNNQKVIY